MSALALQKQGLPWEKKPAYSELRRMLTEGLEAF
jgi:hypothetical protein